MLLTLTGCGEGRTSRDVYSTNIKKLHRCYQLFMDNNNDRGPKDEAELKNYVKTNRTAMHILKRLDVTPETVDDIFISERDEEPFTVRYGLKGEADHAIVFEKTGVDGERLIALSKVAAYGEQEYDDFLSGKTKPKTMQEADALEEEDEDTVGDTVEE